MNYQKVYNQIVERAKTESRSRSSEVYYELHHILPRCIGGRDSDNNKVLLTGREHFICHWLLHRLYPDSIKLGYAFWMMCVQKNSKQQRRYVPSSRVYEEAKVGYLELYSRTPRSKEHCDNISKSKKGKPNPLVSKALKGKKPWNLGKGGTDYIITGRKQSQAHKENRSIALKNIPHEIVKCPHCQAVGGKSIMKRWHFNNCKKK